MAQKAFTRIGNVDLGNTGSPTIKIQVLILWFGDQLAGDGYETTITVPSTASANNINTAVTNAVVARAAELGGTIAPSDVLFIDRVV